MTKSKQPTRTVRTLDNRQLATAVGGLGTCEWEDITLVKSLDASSVKSLTTGIGGLIG